MALVNPNLRTKNILDYQFTKEFPLRENCDLDDPREMFLWMFAALPGVNGGHFILPVNYWMMVSEHLYECGARLSGEPMKKYRRPEANDPNWATSPGSWVPLDTPDPPVDPARQAWEKLSPQQKAEIKRIANEDE